MFCPCVPETLDPGSLAVRMVELRCGRQSRRHFNRRLRQTSMRANTSICALTGVRVRAITSVCQLPAGSGNRWPANGIIARSRRPQRRHMQDGAIRRHGRWWQREARPRRRRRGLGARNVDPRRKGRGEESGQRGRSQRQHKEHTPGRCPAPQPSRGAHVLRAARFDGNQDAAGGGGLAGTRQVHDPGKDARLALLQLHPVRPLLPCFN